ncbi:hypothetical protein tpqmel_0118 [Candidatus Gastranaerophilus sp. (ex Termes propinquus)]|nr:hypothetical protein tpqmel_0118 [Candidatus Gastranaerophilus sp. (ex Termes propinquus)]
MDINEITKGHKTQAEKANSPKQKEEKAKATSARAIDPDIATIVSINTERVKAALAVNSETREEYDARRRSELSLAIENIKNIDVTKTSEELDTEAKLKKLQLKILKGEDLTLEEIKFLYETDKELYKAYMKLMMLRGGSIAEEEEEEEEESSEALDLNALKASGEVENKEGKEEQVEQL